VYKQNVKLAPSQQKVVAEAEVTEETVQQGDSLLVCCDGIFERLSNEEVVAFVVAELQRTPKDPALVMAKLMEESARAGSSDNMTAMLVQFTHDEEEAEVQGRQYLPSGFWWAAGKNAAIISAEATVEEGTEDDEASEQTNDESESLAGSASPKAAGSAEQEAARKKTAKNKKKKANKKKKKAAEKGEGAIEGAEADTVVSLEGLSSAPIDTPCPLSMYYDNGGSDEFWPGPFDCYAGDEKFRDTYLKDAARYGVPNGPKLMAAATRWQTHMPDWALHQSRQREAQAGPSKDQLMKMLASQMQGMTREQMQAQFKAMGLN
jgi:hypothetical protein